MVVDSSDMKLCYDGEYESSHPIVIEMEDSIISELSEKHVYIKTDRNGVAFMCTKSDTYKIRQVDNSNTQIFVDKVLPNEGKIRSSTPGVVQLEKVITASIPDSDVKESLVRNSNNPDNLAHIVYDTIWSEEKIADHLRRNDLYWIQDGKWKLFDESLFFEYTDLILSTCAIIGGTNNNEFSSEEIWMSMNESMEADGAPPLPLEIVQYLLSRLSPDESISFKNKGESDWPLNIALDPTKVLIHRGKHVLFSKLKNRENINLDRFVMDWKDSLETTVLVDACLIEEEALLNNLKYVISDYAALDNDLLIRFSPRDLPFDIEKRIIELFKVKDKWKKQEFEFYFETLLNEGVKPESVLLKSCRLDQADEDGEWVYSSKF